MPFMCSHTQTHTHTTHKYAIQHYLWKCKIDNGWSIFSLYYCILYLNDMSFVLIYCLSVNVFYKLPILKSINK